MKFPPPPKTVTLETPSGITGDFRAYNNDGQPKVNWDPDRGQWVCNASVAHWERSKTSITGWTLATNTESGSRKALDELEQRFTELHAAVEHLYAVLDMEMPETAVVTETDD